MNRIDSRTSIGPERIEMLCDLERWADALPLVSRLLASEPENEVAWCLLAQCQLGLGRYDRALRAAQRAAALAPDNEWPYRLLSFAASYLGQHDTAVQAAREAVRLDPDAWQTHARLAAAAVRRQADGAGRNRRAWPSRPDRPDRLGRLGRLGRTDRKPGRSEARNQARNEAAWAADRALALAPDEPQVQLIYGTVAASQGQREVAERAYRAALHLDPQSSGAHHLLAVLRLRRRTGPVALAEAATGFATALAADPTAQISRHSLELTLRLFLGRAAYGLFVTAYLSLLFVGHSTLWSRSIPVLLLTLPAVFVIGFLRRLNPQLRSFLGQLLRRGPTACAVGLELLCVGLMAAGVFAGQQVRPELATAATIIALLARLVLYLGTRRLRRSRSNGKPA